jgi:PAS domain S-box-containing protein
VLADRLDAATREILESAGHGAAPLFTALVDALRTGGMPPVHRGAAAPYLRQLHALKSSIAPHLGDARAGEVWFVADWFAHAAEQTHTNENRRLVAMMDALPEHLIMQDREARILFVNRASGTFAAGVLKRPVDDVIGYGVMDADQPEEFKTYALGVVTRALAGETFTEEFVQPSDEGPYWRETTIAPVRGADGEIEAVAMTSRDVNARKIAEARLRLLSKIGALVGTDSAGILVSVPSATVPELADIAMVEFAGSSRVEVAHADPLRATEVRELLQGRRFEDAPELGVTSTLSVPLLALDTPLAVAHFAFTKESGRRHSDSDRTIAQDVARRITQIVENALLHEEVAQSLVYRERVMGILGHDLRNPLSAVLSLSKMFSEKPDVPDRTREALGHIRSSAERMEQMIHTILDFTQLRFRGAPVLTLEGFDFAQLVRSLVTELQAAHPTRAIDVATPGVLRGRWDYTRMGQVVSNLIANALTHGERESPVTVDLAGDRESVVLTVGNRGPAIPVGVMSKLFEPFWQANDTKRRGLGLGLFISQQIVEAHGGAIDVESANDHTTFCVRLPIASE